MTGSRTDWCRRALNRAQLSQYGLVRSPSSRSEQPCVSKVFMPAAIWGHVFIAPIWSNTTWTGALLLASAVSTGVAVIVLVDRRFRLNAAEDTIHRLELLDSSNG
jgi:hypothetical protein